MMKGPFVIFISLLLLLLSVENVSGHGYMSSPRTRNWFAAEDGLASGSSEGLPSREYCPHCLNTNNGVCGVSTSFDYDVYKDSTGISMPWISQATYNEGQIIEVQSYLSTHHNGHMEIRACPMGRTSTQECFDAYELIFVKDLLHDMPVDPSYPERGYYAGGQGGTYKDFKMEFKLPDGIKGEEVLLQWKYITANSCSPPGYVNYFGNNTDLPTSYWSPMVRECSPPYPNDGTRSGVWPEQFWNCAEVSIEDANPTISPSPTIAPTTARPTVTPRPTLEPTTPRPTITRAPVYTYGDGCCSMDFKYCNVDWNNCGTGKEACEACGDYFWITTTEAERSGCQARWTGCTNDPAVCCPGALCKVQNPFYSQCSSPTDEAPTPAPVAPIAPVTPPPVIPTTPLPTPSPMMVPTTAVPTRNPNPPSPGCCSMDFKYCNVDWSDCGNGPLACAACDYFWITTTPTERATCQARWTSCTTDPTICCPGAVCEYRSASYSECSPPGVTPAPTMPSSSSPTSLPTAAPTSVPTTSPSTAPTLSPAPIMDPSLEPTGTPTGSPTGSPNGSPTDTPTGTPTGIPNGIPTSSPTGIPTSSPTGIPTGSPTGSPTVTPMTEEPSTASPTTEPSTALPTTEPSTEPPSSPPVGAAPGCCSMDFKVCNVNWNNCGSSKEACEACGSYFWITSTTAERATCRARWQACTHDPAVCCPGAVCDYRGPYYSECSPP